MSKHTTFKIGGSADFFVIVEQSEKLIELLKYLNEEGIDYFILGGGSNMLVRDEGFRGVVIKIQNKSCKIQDETLVVSGGHSTVDASQKSVQEGLVGFEWGVGVPGTIGGAVRGNAGAMGGEMKDVIEEVDVYRDGEIFILKNKEINFGYRDSIFKHNTDIIIQAKLKLKSGDKKLAIAKMMDAIKYRNTTQPKGYASTGCIFKNFKIASDFQTTTHPPKWMNSKPLIPQQFLDNHSIPAGWLVEQIGMKGQKIGQAQVSDRHGNFIVNLGGASASDVLQLIEKIKEKVYNKYGFELEEEIQII